MDFRREIESTRQYIDSIAWEKADQYAAWLSQQYYIVKRSTPYLGLCLFHSDKYPAFQKRCIQHINEEKGHEVLIENDLKALGWPLLAELPETASIYQTQHFRIVAQNPMSFLGYVFFLELLAPVYGPEVIEKVNNPKASNFLKVHAINDDDHLEEAAKIYETMTDELRHLVAANFLATKSSYQSMLKAIAESSSRKNVDDVFRLSQISL